MNYGHAPNGTPQLLHQFFAFSAARWPEQVAVDVPSGGQRLRQQMTYRQLAVAATAVQRQLAPVVQRECVVAILLPRGTPWLYAAQLGVLQSGAAYVCLDASLPDAHLRFLLDDSGAVSIVTDADGERLLQRIGSRVPHQVSVPRSDADSGSLSPPAWLGPSSLAYVIYTSGTTGPPKGVLLEHRGIANLVAADLANFGLRPGDRVAQGSSPAYDSSIEETWLALASGGTVVVMDDDAARLGPDLVGWLRDERISVFCPPPTQLRAMACREPARELPMLRLLYVGGEALTQDLADHWAKVCWLENGYGPTECSVTVVRGRIHEGRPVTIGRAVSGHRALVLDPRLQLVADGAEGELCIAGPGLARGYLNRPELTAERFPVHAQFGRIYRTGDLVQLDANGDLVCLGRIDSQVKLRGYRIELAAIEATLADCPGVRQAACRLCGSGADAQLVAFVVPLAVAAPPDVAQLRAQLGARLPGYMVPSRIAVLATLPTTVGGKLDRRALPDLPPEPGPAERNGQRPRDELEAALAHALAGLLAGAGSISVDEDFFAAGGDSLRAAQWISRLRVDPETATLTVRDVYEARTIAGLAARVRNAAAGQAPDPRDDLRGASVANGSARARPGLVLAGQLLWLASSLGLVSLLGYAIGFQLLPALCTWLGLVAAALLLPLCLLVGFVVYTAVTIALAVVTKRMLLGRVSAGSIPVWSIAFLRHWIVQQTVRLVPWAALQGTELQRATLRRLGARIGARVHIHRGVDLLRGGWDLLSIGDDATLCQDASLLLATLVNGHVVMAPIEIGARCTVDVRACVSGGAKIADDAVLMASAWLPPNRCIPPGEAWDGIPAARVGAAPDAAPLPAGAREMGIWSHAAAHCMARAMLSLVVALPACVGAGALFAMLAVDARQFIEWLSAPWSAELWLVLALPVVALPLTLGWKALLARWIAPATPGHVPLRSASNMRMQFAIDLGHAAGEWLSGTLFWPWWLRIAGMRLGRRCEISTILDTVPRHVQIGAETFFADGVYLAGPRIHRGVVSLLPTTVGCNTFLGNHAIVPIGSQVPDDVLLGVCTVANDRLMSRGTDWFGHPPFALPRREVIVVDRRLTHEPGFLRKLNRVGWEAMRCLLLLVPTLLTVVWFLLIATAETWGSPARLLGAVPLATLVVALAACTFVLALKWALLGRVRPGQHALWSCWCSRWDFFYVAWHRLARPLLTALEGTALLPWYLRAMGASIGRHVVLGPGFAQLVDPDMIHIEDGATVDAQFQAHSFEDRVLKIDHLHIRRGASVGHGAVLLYGADIGAGAEVAPQSVVMKHERLTERRHYVGFPVRAVGAAAAPNATVGVPRP